jgi:sulfoquinovosidase
VVMRTHEGNRPSLNSQVYDTAQSAAAFARMTRLYAALAPYRRQVITEAVRTGVPAVRHDWLVVPGTAAATVDTQFFLGDHLLVAPVLKAGATSVRVTFPPGRWVNLLSGSSYAGDRTVEVPAALGSPAAFLSADDPWLPRLRAAVRAVG